VIISGRPPYPRSYPFKLTDPVGGFSGINMP
jgi:hypothetical protein